VKWTQRQKKQLTGSVSVLGEAVHARIASLSSTLIVTGARAGNPARERMRGSNPTVSKHAPKVGCPKNYYSKTWVSNLGSRQMVDALKMKPYKDLGETLEK
jgi:hypothetical protein